MAQTAPPSMTPTPTPVIQRGDRATFANRLDAFLNWLSGATGEFAAATTNVYNNAVDCYNNAVAAASAAASAIASAATAFATANAAPWVSGTTYAVGDAVISPITLVTYRRKVAGAGVLDPSADGTNWVALTVSMLRRVTTITTSSTPTANTATDDVLVITALASSATIAAPSGTPASGQNLMYCITDNGTARLIAYNTIFRASPDLPLPNTTVAGKTLYLGFKYNIAASKWDLLAVLGNF